MKEQQMEALAKFSYRIAFYFLKDIDDAKDISQTVMFNCLKNKKDLENDGAFGLIKKATTQESYRYAKAKKKRISFAELEKIITKALIFTSPDEINEKYMIIKKFLKKFGYFEIDLLQNYFNRGCKIKKLVLHRKQSYHTLKKKIYRLKRDILSQYYIYAGMEGTKKIINAKLHENITNFIKKFKTALETNSVEQMRIYFGKRIEPDLIPELDVFRFHDYYVRLLDRNKYRLIVHYFDSNNEYNCYFLHFRTYYRNRIRIIELPRLPKKITCYDAKKIPTHIKEQLKPDTKGVFSIPKKKLQQLLKDFKPIYVK